MDRQGRLLLRRRLVRTDARSMGVMAHLRAEYEPMPLVAPQQATVKMTA